VVAVADPDEWDKNPHPPSSAYGWYKTGLETPEIDISNLEAGTVEVKFDSSWRPEFDSDYHQAAKLRVRFDNGTPIDLVTWESIDQGGQKTRITVAGQEPFVTFSDLDLLNTTEVIPVPNPNGAQVMKLEFYMYDAGNDWWWAIDNLEITGEQRGTVEFVCSDIDQDHDVDSADFIDLLGGWTGAEGTGATFETGDCDSDGDIDVLNMLDLLANWTGALGAGLVDLPAGVVGPAPLARGAVAAVPEPASALCGILGLSLGCLMRRGNRANSYSNS
jgi:hypothetical protein